MNRLQQTLVWMSRISHCRGFGIQSPSDYIFVRYVVNERWPYYAYSQLAPADDWLRRKLGRLYFRLANHLQPRVAADLVGCGEYLLAGCRRTHIEPDVSPSASLIIAPPTASADSIIKACQPGTVVVVEHIARHHSPCWQAIESCPQATVTFDLYYCGIALFDPKRTKQHYIVNF